MQFSNFCMLLREYIIQMDMKHLARPIIIAMLNNKVSCGVI